MARRTYHLQRRCDVKGCKEIAIYEYKTRKDYDSAVNRWHGVPYKCSYHRVGDGSLSTDNTEFSQTLRYVNGIHGDYGNKFFSSEGKLTTGFIYGDGWACKSDLLPVGAIVEVVTTVRVILPSPATESAGDDDE